MFWIVDLLLFKYLTVTLNLFWIKYLTSLARCQVVMLHELYNGIKCLTTLIAIKEGYRLKLYLTAYSILFVDYVSSSYIECSTVDDNYSLRYNWCKIDIMWGTWSILLIINNNFRVHFIHIILNLSCNVGISIIVF